MVAEPLVTVMMNLPGKRQVDDGEVEGLGQVEMGRDVNGGILRRG